MYGFLMIWSAVGTVLFTVALRYCRASAQNQRVIDDNTSAATTTRIHVGGITKGTTLSSLAAMFESFGNLSEVRQAS